MAIKTAKDILKENEGEKEEKSAVDEAYESISKRLESIRRGENPPADSEEDEDNKIIEEAGEEERDEPANSEEEDPLDREDVEEEDEKNERDDLDDFDDKHDSNEDGEPAEDERGEKDSSKETFIHEKEYLKEPDPLNREPEGEEDPVQPDDPNEKLSTDDESDIVKPKKTFVKSPSDDGKPTTFDDLVDNTKEEDYEKPQAKSAGPSVVDGFDNDIPNLRANRPSEQQHRFHNAMAEYGPQDDPRAPMRNVGGDDANRFFNRHSTMPPKRASNKWHLIVLLLIGIGVIGATVYLLKGQFSAFDEGSPSPSPQAVQSSPSPLPSPSPELVRSNYKVRILNGTSKSGFAKEVLDKLGVLGYQKDRAANATNSAFEQTVVRVKEGQASISAQVIKDLAPDLDAQAQENLRANDTVDIEIILGEK